jgi:excisionase family DNA binding protein
VDELLHIKEVAKRLGICVRGVWRLIASGHLPKPVKVGAASRLPASEVAAYIERLKRERRQ